MAKTKLYLILATTCLVLFFYGTWQIKPYSVNVQDFLGLTSHLTPAYWVGLVLIVFCSIRVYLDRETQPDFVFLFVLVVFGLYIAGVTAFSSDYPSNANSYYPAGEVRTLLSTHHLIPGETYSPISYHVWPAFHFLSATLLYLTNMSFDAMAMFMPLFFLLVFILVPYAAGKYVRLSPNQCFLCSFLAVASGFAVSTYYAPFSFGLAAYFILFLLILEFNIRSLAWIICVLVCVSWLIITHELTSVALIIALVGQSIYRKQFVLLSILLVAFISWYIYFAPWFFDVNVRYFWDQLRAFDFSFIFGYGGAGGIAKGSLIVQVLRYLFLTHLVVYVVLVFTSGFLFITGRISAEKKKFIWLGSFWVVSLASLLAIKYGFEMNTRLYVFSLIPIIIIVVMSLPYRKLFVAVMLLFVIVAIPSRYGLESVGQTLPTEMFGSKFFATTIAPKEPYMYLGSPYVLFWNPDLVNYGGVGYELSEGQAGTKEFLRVRYVVDSKLTHDFALVHYNQDPLEEYLAENPTVINKLYSNGAFDLFERLR